MTERPAQQSPDWDPTVADPLYVEEWLDLDPYATPAMMRRAYARKPGVSRAVLAWTFAALVVILAILAAALLVAAPRAAPEVELNTQGQPGASGPASTAPMSQQADEAVTRPEATKGLHELRLGLLPDTSTSVSGTASWYCGGGSACTRGYPPGTLAAAAGPALRVGDWRGRIVKVCSGGRCVKVSLVDWCACPRRVIDLYRSAFSRLANPSRGLLRVSITWGGSTVVLPPTDTR